MDVNVTKQKLFHKDFTLVVIGQIISLFGNAVVRFALPLYLLNVTGSAALFGITSACSVIPGILLTPVGGIIADRVNSNSDDYYGFDYSNDYLHFKADFCSGKRRIKRENGCGEHGILENRIFIIVIIKKQYCQK